MITAIRIPIVQQPCDGIYLRWWFNGWHYYNFTSRQDVAMTSDVADVQVTEVFSVISRVERATKIKTTYKYKAAMEGIRPAELDGFANLLIAERVDQFEGAVWREVDVTRGTITLREDDAPAYVIEFEVTRKELPSTPAVFQPTQLLYIGDTLADLDDGEVIALNKQVNNVAELQDRQSDFTAQFKIRKTRAMRALFELSGEVGANSAFPYVQHSCKLVQDGIEIITGGLLSLTKSDDQYYYVAIYSGNKSFFDATSKLKLNQLTLTTANHTWDIAAMAASHTSDLDYLYPVCEPSDDGGYLPLADIGNTVTILGDKVWPFVRAKAVFDEIFSNAGYTPQGAILSNPKFLALWMPIVSRKATGADKYKYSLYNNTVAHFGADEPFNQPGNVAVNGAEDALWAGSAIYLARYTAKYKVRVYLIWRYDIGTGDQFDCKLTSGEQNIAMEVTEQQIDGLWVTQVSEGEIELAAGAQLVVKGDVGRTKYFDISITAIEDPKLGFGSDVLMAQNMPDMLQTDFLKAICNMFALVPEADPRSRTVYFWNYADLYANMPQARDWSAYLSERDDDVEFKFGEYAQLNYMRYKESDDVIPNNGLGVMQINDANLAESKDMFTVPFSYSDEVLVYGENNQRTCRIAFNTYDSKLDTYNAEDKIDPRIVFVARMQAGYYVRLQDVVTLDVTEVAQPKKASTGEVSFGALAPNYASLANMLYRAKLRHAKFNLPAYEVARFRHYIPIYVRQYKAYFYVNKISNYVHGKLCTCDLIKL
jgi:hypothetical protein